MVTLKKVDENRIWNRGYNPYGADARSRAIVDAFSPMSLPHTSLVGSLQLKAWDKLRRMNRS